MKSKSYIVHYIYGNGIKSGQGSYIMTQSKYRPITPDDLPSMIAEVKRLCDFEDDMTVVILGFTRFEADGEES